jgi:SPP1 family predicted phage head-tail adaptor
VRRRAGERRHLVALQAPTRVQSTTGHTESWATYANVYAAVRPASASQVERAVAQTIQTPTSHLVELDYRDDVRVAHRVLFGTRALHIVGMQNVEERNETYVLACEERAA